MRDGVVRDGPTGRFRSPAKNGFLKNTAVTGSEGDRVARDDNPTLTVTPRVMRQYRFPISTNEFESVSIHVYAAIADRRLRKRLAGQTLPFQGIRMRSSRRIPHSNRLAKIPMSIIPIITTSVRRKFEALRTI